MSYSVPGPLFLTYTRKGLLAMLIVVIGIIYQWEWVLPGVSGYTGWGMGAGGSGVCTGWAVSGVLRGYFFIIRCLLSGVLAFTYRPISAIGGAC